MADPRSRGFRTGMSSDTPAAASTQKQSPPLQKKSGFSTTPASDQVELDMILLSKVEENDKIQQFKSRARDTVGGYNITVQELNRIVIGTSTFVRPILEEYKKQKKSTLTTATQPATQSQVPAAADASVTDAELRAEIEELKKQVKKLKENKHSTARTITSLVPSVGSSGPQYSTNPQDPIYRQRGGVVPQIASSDVDTDKEKLEKEIKILRDKITTLQKELDVEKKKNSRLEEKSKKLVQERAAAENKLLDQDIEINDLKEKVFSLEQKLQQEKEEAQKQKEAKEDEKQIEEEQADEEEAEEEEEQEEEAEEEEAEEEEAEEEEAEDQEEDVETSNKSTWNLLSNEWVRGNEIAREADYSPETMFGYHLLYTTSDGTNLKEAWKELFETNGKDGDVLKISTNMPVDYSNDQQGVEFSQIQEIAVFDGIYSPSEEDLVKAKSIKLHLWIGNASVDDEEYKTGAYSEETSATFAKTAPELKEGTVLVANLYIFPGWKGYVNQWSKIVPDVYGAHPIAAGDWLVAEKRAEIRRTTVPPSLNPVSAINYDGENENWITVQLPGSNPVGADPISPRLVFLFCEENENILYTGYMLRHAGSGPYKSTMKYDNIALVSYDKETKFTSVGAEKYSTTHAALSTENEIKFEDEDTSLLFFVTQISETGGDKFSIEASTEEKVFGKTSTHKKFLNDLEKKVQVENEGFTLRVIYNTIVAPTTAKAKNKSEEKPSILTKDSLFGICLSKEQRRSPLVIDHPSELSVVFTDISDKETTTITSGKNGRVATFPKAAVSTKATSEVLDARLADDQYYISSKARLSAFPHSSSSSFSFTDVTPMSYSVLGGDDDDDFYKETTSTKSKLAVLSTQGL